MMFMFVKKESELKSIMFGPNCLKNSVFTGICYDFCFCEVLFCFNEIRFFQEFETETNHLAASFFSQLFPLFSVYSSLIFMPQSSFFLQHFLLWRRRFLLPLFIDLFIRHRQFRIGGHDTFFLCNTRVLNIRILNLVHHRHLLLHHLAGFHDKWLGSGAQLRLLRSVGMVKLRVHEVTRLNVGGGIREIQKVVFFVKLEKIFKI